METLDQFYGLPWTSQTTEGGIYRIYDRFPLQAELVTYSDFLTIRVRMFGQKLFEANERFKDGTPEEKNVQALELKMRGEHVVYETMSSLYALQRTPAGSERGPQ